MQVRAHVRFGSPRRWKLGVRIEFRPLIVRKGLHSDIVHVGSSAARLLVVDPDGNVRSAPRGSAIEKQQLLLRDSQRDEIRKEFRQPWAACPDDDIALKARRVLKRDRCTVRSCSSAHDARPVRNGLCGERLHRALGTEHSALWLVEDKSEVVAAEGRVLLGGAGDVETLDRNSLRCERALRGGFPAVLAVGEPCKAALQEEFLPGLFLELVPERARPAGHGCVLSVGSVGAAVEARLAT
jgi:hypothetical protein